MTQEINAWAYVRSHREEIDEDIRQNEKGDIEVLSLDGQLIRVNRPAK